MGNTFLAWVGLVSVLVSLPAWAHAQPGVEPSSPSPQENSDPAVPPPPPPQENSDPAALPPPAATATVAAPPPVITSTKQAGILEDANSGANFITPTALMPPEGTWSFNSTELFFLGASYSFTDQVLFSIQTLVPIVPDEFQPYMLTGKFGLVDSGQVHLALHGALAGSILNDGDQNDSFNTLTLGGTLTFCLDGECHSYLNGYAGLGFLLASDVDQTSVPVVFGGALAKKLGRHVKLLIEVDSGAVIGDYDEVADGVLGFYGLRFAYSSIAVNAGLVRPFGPDVEMDAFPLGFPWVGFTYRGLPEG